MADTLSNKTKSGDFDWPTTTEDHTNMEQWEVGDDLKGTFAKSNAWYKSHSKDFNRAYGNENAYDGKILYVDTFHKDGIGKQLKRLKK